MDAQLRLSWKIWRDLARRRLPRFIFDYLEGGAEDEQCLLTNELALQRIHLIPRRLTNVENPTLQTTFFGRSAALPIAIAPTGFNSLFWPDGDLELARAAARNEIPFALSTAANAPVEKIAAIPGIDCWLQLYVFENPRAAERLMHRAQTAGCRVLLLTVDLPVSGYRARDLRNGFSFPFHYRRVGLDLLRHPRWTLRTLRAGIPQLPNVADEPGASLASERDALTRREMSRSLTWQSIEWLRRHWAGPIVLKGILSASDAAKASEAGLQGIVVSNHGGRQLDSAPASIDMLQSIAIEARGMTVLVDSGFRSGSDIVKALALGAHGVLLGRAPLYALAGSGGEGVIQFLSHLRADLQRTLTLLGVSRIEDLRSSHTCVALPRPACSCGYQYPPPERTAVPKASEFIGLPRNELEEGRQTGLPRQNQE